MAIDIEKYLRKRANRINSFSGSYMSDPKWTKVFTILSQQADIATKCLEKSIWDDHLREIPIPTFENFTDSFSQTGILDGVGSVGPTSFDEIEWIEFPAIWTISRRNRNEQLEPFKYKQDIIRLKKILKAAGELETEINNDKLIVYGYK